VKTVFLRALEELHDKEAALRGAILKPEAVRNGQRFEVDPQSFDCVSGSPFAYWVSDRLRSLFKDLPLFESDGRVARRGVNSNDDQRFLRLAWECAGPEWVLHVKGGIWSPYYSDPHMLLKWGHDGKELQAERVNSRVYKFAIVPSRELYFRPGLTWPRRTKSELSFRVMPAGCIFGDKGPAAIIDNDNHDELFCLLAIGNSKVFQSLVEFQLAAADARAGGAAHSYEVGVIQRTPIPNLSATDRTNTAHLAYRAWSLKRSLDTRTETSHAFVLPALLQALGDTLGARANAYVEHVHATEAAIGGIQLEIDQRCFDLYGIDEADRLTITKGFGAAPDELDEPVCNGHESEADSDDDSDSAGDVNAASLAAELVSWSLGVAFGRFEVRLATKVRALPLEPMPFDPVPIRSPGMLIDDYGIPLSVAPSGYPIAFPENGILVDDPGHSRDLTCAVRTVFDEIFGARADLWWNEVAALLNPKDQNLRAWISSGFFGHHLKCYSKSRRKAPVLWQLSVPSGRYSIWLYAHRLTRDSCFQLQNDVVAPKLAHEERQLRNLYEGAGANPSASERKEIAAQEGFVEELRAMLDEVKRVAPLWNPTLNDGVALTMAPLWRLVPQHKSWQKELRAKWDELVSAKYDWAHLAMHLWPERVVPKCATDRSLAIAHGLEEVFWVQGDDGKWKQRPSPTRPVPELVQERTSIAVKAALKSLIEAPVASGNGGRGRGRRAANAAAEVGAR